MRNEIGGRVQLPSYVRLKPVGRCNLRCQMCPIQFRQDGPPHGPPACMDFELFTRIVDDLPTLTELHLQALGEPMMHPHFFEMVRYAADRGIAITTNTNATLLTEERAERCVTSGLGWIHISLDGAARTRTRIRFGESSLRAHSAPMRDFVRQQTLTEEDSARVAEWFGAAARGAAGRGTARISATRATRCRAA